MYNMAAMPFDAGGGLMVVPGASLGGGWVLRIALRMKNVVPMPIAETKRDSLRPRLSAAKKTKKAVTITLEIKSEGHLVSEQSLKTHLDDAVNSRCQQRVLGAGISNG
jgi:hypothetical protein